MIWNILLHILNDSRDSRDSWQFVLFIWPAWGGGVHQMDIPLIQSVLHITAIRDTKRVGKGVGWNAPLLKLLMMVVFCNVASAEHVEEYIQKNAVENLPQQRR